MLLVISNIRKLFLKLPPDLQNVTSHTILDGVKMFRLWVKFVTEHTVFCLKFNLLSQLCTFGGIKVLRNVWNKTFRLFLVNYYCF